MEKQGKSRKSLLLSVIAAVVVLAALLTMTFTGCFGGQDDPTTDSTSQSGESGESGGNVEKSHGLYWNVDRKEAAGKRQPESDGFYHIVFAKDGKQVTLRVADKKLVETIDSQDMVGLVLDDKGDITEVIKMKDLPFETLAENYYVAAIKDGLVELKKNQDLTGEDAMFKLEDSTQVLDMTGVSGEVGVKTTLNKEDGVTVILNEDGEAVYVYVVNRAAAAVTVKKTCEHCKKEVEWTSWTKNGSLPTAAGHYYLETDVNLTAEAAVAAGAQICLDLNGKTINGAANGRVYVTNANSVLSIVDTTETKAGKVIVSGKNMGTGNCLYAKGGTINIYAGTYDASKATSTANGTAVAVNANATINMYGGKIIGGTSKKNAENAFGCAGTVQIEDKGTFNLYDGEITGGKAYNTGGQMRVIGTFNMYGGKVTNGTSYGANGGNISVARMGKLNISGGYILNGTATQNTSGGAGLGGNIFSEGAFMMNGGYVAGGKLLDKNNKALNSATSRNVYHRNQAFTMYGGEILGYMYVADASATDTYNTSIFVSGLANISRAAEGDKNLSWGDRVSFSIGKLLKGAKVSVSAALGDKLIARGNIDEAKWNSYQTMIDNGCLVADNSRYVFKVEEDAIYLVDPDAVYRCICGDKTSTGNACADAGHVDVAWSKWEKTDSLPNTKGNYYLADNVTISASTNVGSNIAIDLNGKTITGAKDVPIFKMAKNGKLTITDSVGDTNGDGMDEGKLIPGSRDVKTTGFFGMIVEQSVNGSELNVYGGTWDCTGKESQYGIAINNWYGTTNLYDATILGGTAFAGGSGGGNIMVNDTFNMYGGTIKDGKSLGDTAANRGGGNIRITSTGTFNMYDGTISGGTAVYNGGSIHTSGKLNLYGGTITTGDATGLADGSAGGLGDCIYVNGGSVTVSGDVKVDDVYLPEGKLITIGEDGLTTGESGALIGVTMKTPDVFTSNAVAEGVEKCFKSNTFGYKVFKNSVNMLALVPGQEDDGGEGGVRHCVCGDPTLKIGACAEAGHVEYTWTEWTETTSLPTDNGFYYLSADVTLTEASKPSNTNVTIDLNGKIVTQSTADTAIVELDGTDIYTVTNTTGEGKVDGAIVTNGSSSLTVYNRSQIKKIENTAGTVKLYSGKIDAATVGGTFVVSGNVVITNATVADGAVITVDKSFMTGNGGASIGVTVTNKDAAFATGEITATTKSSFTSVDAEYAVSNEVGGLRLRPADEVWHCLCGDPSITDENNSCAKAGHVSVKWTAWDGKGGPITQSGNYYLTKDYTAADIVTHSILGDTMVLNTISSNAAIPAPSETLYFNFDLNGYDITSNARLFRVDGSSDYPVHLTLSNSNPGNGGTVKISQSNTDANASKGGIVWILKANTGSTVEIFGGNYDVSDWVCSAEAQGAAIHVAAGTEVTMSGGTLTGTKSANFRGGVVYNGGTFNMNGGTIYGGTAKSGGCVESTKTFTMAGGELVGSDKISAQIQGGALRVYGGTATVTGGTIIAATDNNAVKVEGGGVFVLGDSTIFDMTGGTIDATGKTVSYGGCITVYRGTANLTNVELLGGTAKGSGGGVISVVGGTTNVTNCTIKNGTAAATSTAATHGGGCVNVGTGIFNMNGGSISGGTAANGHGGGINVRPGSTVTISGNAVIKDNVGTNLYIANGESIAIGEAGLGEKASIGVTMATPGKLTSAVIASGIFFSDDANFQATAEADGVYLRDASLVYGCICGSESVKHAVECNGLDVLWTKLEATSDLSNGGYFYLDADTTVADVTVAEGKTLAIDLKGKTLTGNVTATAANTELYILDSASGGKLAGKVNAMDATAFGGTIAEAAVNGRFVVAGDVKIEAAVVAADKFITVSESGLTTGENGAKIVLSAADASKAVVKGATKENTACFVSAVETLKVNREGDGIHLRPADEVWHCLCGNVDSEVENSSCSKAGHVAVKWTPWDGKAGPITKSGNYYLTKDYTAADIVTHSILGDTLVLNTISSNAAIPAPSEVLYFNFDLNGYNITSGARLFRVDGNATYPVHLTLSNSNPDKVGTVKVTSSSDNPDAMKGGIVWVMKANTKSTVEIFGGNYDASGWACSKEAQGAAVYVNTGNEFTMSGGTLTGTNSANYRGGAVYNAGTFNMNGGTIYGGTAKSGGCVESTKTFTMAGGELVGSDRISAPIQGGALRVYGGTATVTGGTITAATDNGGTKVEGGGVFVVGDNSVFNMTGGTIDATGKQVNYGGCFANYGGTSTLTNVELKGGTAKGSGGGAISVAGGTLTVNNCTITNGTAANTSTAVTHGGGCVNVGKATFNMIGGSISGGTAANGHGAGINVRPGSTVTISGDAVIVKNEGTNLYIADTETIAIGEAGLGENAYIGVSMATPGNFTSNAVEAAQQVLFESDKAEFAVEANADGTLKLVAKQ